MSLGLRKSISILIVCLTALGVIISIFMVVEVWHYRQPFTEKLQSGTEQLATVLQITDNGLMVIDQVVKNVYTSTVYLNDATSAFSQTVQSTSVFMDSAGIFIGDNLLSTITNTQTALGSAQASATVIDNILTTLSRVPLIGITYNPAVPLNKALGDVASSLDPLQATLKNFQINLNGTRQDMQSFSSQISVLNRNIQSIQQNLNQAQLTIKQYRSQITQLQKLTQDVSDNLPRWMTIMAWIITLLLVWLILIQVSILLQATLQINTNRFAPELTHPSE